MKILVGDKRVVGDDLHIHIKPDGAGAVTHGVRSSAYRSSEIAPDEAMLQRDQSIVIQAMAVTPDSPIPGIDGIEPIGGLSDALPEFGVALG